MSPSVSISKAIAKSDPTEKLNELKDNEPTDDVLIRILPPLLSKISGNPSPLRSATNNSLEPLLVRNSNPFVNESVFDVVVFK